MQWIIEKIESKKRQVISITPKDFELAKELFTILNVPFYEAPNEAEKMCAKLAIDGHVVAVLSEDTDVIAYHAPIFLTKINTFSDLAVQIKPSAIHSSLDINAQILLDFCIMNGTDYNCKHSPNRCTYCL